MKWEVHAWPSVIGSLSTVDNMSRYSSVRHGQCWYANTYLQNRWTIALQNGDY